MIKWLTVALVVILAIAGTARWILGLMKRAAQSSVELALSPVERARQRFDHLEGGGGLDAGDRRPAYVEMSEIVRQYLEAALGLPARDATTSELASALNETSVDSHDVEVIVEWLRAADLVKFAGYSVTEDETRASLYTARRWIESINSSATREGNRLAA